MRSFIIGTRGSDLALWQANFVRSELERTFPSYSFEIRIIKTTGDQVQEIALSKIGDKGLFTRQIENELLNGGIDLAVHSLKDLQTEQPEGLIIGAVCERELPNDILISKKFTSIEDLPSGAKIATGSLRRRSQILNRRPDVEIVEIRGNVPTRLEKYKSSDLDGMILAYAGVHRLDLEQGISHVIPTDVMVPAVGQGAVAIEIRANDPETEKVVASLDHPTTRKCVTAERSFLRKLEGGCQVPIGAYATISGTELSLQGVVGSLDGKTVFRDRIQGAADKAEDLGLELAERLIQLGADKLVFASRNEATGA